MFVCLALVLLCGLALAAVEPTRRNTGEKWVFTRDIATMLLEKWIIPSLEVSVNGVSIPDISGTMKTSAGKIEYSVSNIKIMNFKIPNDGFTLDSENNQIEMYVELNATLQLDYSYQMLSFPYTSDKGSATISITGATLDAYIKPYRNSFYGVGLSLPYINVDVPNFDVDIESDKAWLYELILSVFQDKITASISEILSVAMSKAINDLFDTFLNYGVSAYNIGIGAIVDVGMTTESGFIVHDNWVDVEISLFPIPERDGYDPNDRSLFDDMTEVESFADIHNSKMFQIIISKQRFLELLKVQNEEEFFRAVYSMDSTHPEYFQPSYWNSVIDMTGYSDVSEWSYDITFGKDVQLELLASAMRITEDVIIHFLDQNKIERFQLAATVLIGAHTVMGSDGLTFDEVVTSIKGVEVSSPGPSVITSDYTSIKNMINDVFLADVNSKLSLGGYTYQDLSLTDDYFIAEDESFEIYPDSDKDGYIVYSMNPRPII